MWKWMMVCALASLTLGCATRYRVRQLPPMPPVWVECRQPEGPIIPEPPSESYVDWLMYGPGWAVDVLDALALERQYRKLEHECSVAQRDRILGIEP